MSSISRSVFVSKGACPREDGHYEQGKAAEVVSIAALAIFNRGSPGATIDDLNWPMIVVDKLHDRGMKVHLVSVLTRDG